MKLCFQKNGRKLYPKADIFYIWTVVTCTLLILVFVLVIIGLGIYFGFTEEEYFTSNKFPNVTALAIGNESSILLNSEFYHTRLEIESR